MTQAGGTGDNGQIGAPYTVRFAKGQFAGVRIKGNRNIVAGRGGVRNFAAGIVIEGGSANTVTRVTVEENFGPPGSDDLGDGIVVLDSTGNQITANTVRNNGPFDGIVLLGGAGRNVIRANLIVDNRQPEISPLQVNVPTRCPGSRPRRPTPTPRSCGRLSTSKRESWYPCGLAPLARTQR